MEPEIEQDDRQQQTVLIDRVARVTRGSTFAVGWALANIIHLLNQTNGDLAFPVSWLNLMVALWVLGRPTSAHRLAGLAAAQLLDTVWLAPFVPDHQVLAAFVNIAILGGYFALRRPNSSDELLARVAPGARILLLIAYGAAALAKYNSDFLEPLRSCAAFVADNATYGLTDAESPLAQVHIWGTLVIESLVPVLLLIRRTRRWGVIFAAAFHFVVSLSPAISVADFTYLLWPLFGLFLPSRDMQEIGRRVVEAWRGNASVSRYDRVPRWVFAGLFSVVLLIAASSGPTVFLFVWLFTTFFGLWLLLTAIRVLRELPAQVEPIGPLHPGQILLALAMFILVLGPYLGFGTSSRFTMFSGVRTEGPGTNHLFIPSVHLIDSQNEALVVVWSNGESEALALAAEAKAAIPVAELRRVLANEQVGARLQTEEGERITVVAGVDHPLREPAPWWEAKTQHYRPFKVDGVTDPGFCSN